MTKKQKQQKGFTIVEIVITLFIIGVMLLLYQVAAMSTKHNNYSGYKETAVRIAHQEIQSLRKTPFASIPGSGSFTNSMVESLPNGSANRTITDIDDGIIGVRIEVTWTNPGETNPKTVELETKISQGGLGQQ